VGAVSVGDGREILSHPTFQVSPLSNSEMGT
jgi:hypothetical protein